MTISSTANRKEYTGNGATLDFAFPYKFLANADLKVYDAGTLKTITTHYTVTGAGLDGGGTVSFLVAPANGNSVVILRSPTATQELDLVENDQLPAESVENAFDKITMLVQRLDDRVDRALVVSDTDVSGADFTVPPPAADEVLKWNAAADALETATIAELGAVVLPLAINQGGTGAATADDALTGLGGTTVGKALFKAATVAAAQQAIDVEVGVDVQAYDADTAKLDVDQTWTGAQRGNITTDNDGSFDQAASNHFFCTPAGAVALTFTNHTAGQSGLVLFVNDSNYDITAAATTYISAADLAKISVTGSYLLSYLDNGTNAYCVVSAALTSAGV